MSLGISFTVLGVSAFASKISIGRASSVYSKLLVELCLSSNPSGYLKKNPHLVLKHFDKLPA